MMTPLKLNRKDAKSAKKQRIKDLGDLGAFAVKRPLYGDTLETEPQRRKERKETKN